LSAHVIFINSKSRQLYYAKSVVETFSYCIKSNSLKGLSHLLWHDIILRIHLSNQEIYGKPYVIKYFDTLLTQLSSVRIIDVNLAVMPKNKPAIIIHYQSNSNVPQKAIFVFTIVEHKIIEIERLNSIPYDMIIAK
jgi:hypothetical protein